MSFISILFNKSESQIKALHSEPPEFFIDLNLDQIIDAITEKWFEYNLKPFFYFHLCEINEIKYRQEVFNDLESESLYKLVKLFTEKMREVHKLLKLSEKVSYKYQKEIWFLYAAEIYCQAIKNFIIGLLSEPLNSRGFISFKEFLINYSASIDFTTIDEEANLLKIELEKVKYHIIINQGSFTVQQYAEGIDLSNEINKIFEKFRQNPVSNYLVKYDSSPENMNHVEAKILEFVAQLNQNLFSRLENFYITHKGFINKNIEEFDREIHFYISYREYIKKFIDIGLQFCSPQIVNTTKATYNIEGFDLALAQKLYEINKSIVCNNFYLKDKERIIVVTGPNQGGKTTFARMFGQLHYLASIGCMVPGKSARLFIFDKLFTIFEKSEKVENLRGKLEYDLTRIHYVLENSTTQSIIIINEIFNSATLYDIIFLSKKIIERILKLDLICVCVTFLDELASFSKQTVSMTSTIVPENPALRTFKIIRQQADGLAYAMAIAEKYKLTYNQIKERILK